MFDAWLKRQKWITYFDHHCCIFIYLISFWKGGGEKSYKGFEKLLLKTALLPRTHIQHKKDNWSREWSFSGFPVKRTNTKFVKSGFGFLNWNALPISRTDFPWLKSVFGFFVRFQNQKSGSKYKFSISQSNPPYRCREISISRGQLKILLKNSCWVLVGLCVWVIRTCFVHLRIVWPFFIFRFPKGYKYSAIQFFQQKAIRLHGNHLI